MPNCYYPIIVNEATASRRRLTFDLTDALDLFTPELAEAGGQPQISVDGGAWTNAGVGTLVAVGNGRYYAELTQAATNVAVGTRISARYKSAATDEAHANETVVIVHTAHYAAWLAAADYTAPPSASTISTAVRSELTTELGRVDAAVSSRLAATGYTAPDNSSIAAIDARLPAAPASQGDVTDAQTALESRLDTVDGAVAACLQSSAYTAPDNTTIASTGVAVAALPAAISASEAAIRGADSDTLKTLSDQLDGKMEASSYTAPDNVSIAAIKAKTDNLPDDPGDASDIADAINALDAKLGTPAVSLAADVATRASSVELAAAETAIRGADSDTLKTLSDQLDLVAPASTALSNTVWTEAKAGYLDASTSSVTTAVAASETAIRGADSDTLKTLSDQIDDIPSQVASQADIAGMAAGVAALPGAISASEDAIRGEDEDTLKTLSDQIDQITYSLGHGTCTIRTVDEEGHALDGVRVTLYDMSNTFVTFGYTGSAAPGTGEVHFSVPASEDGTSYKAYLYQAGVSFLPDAAKVFVVKDPAIGPDFNVFSYEGHLGLSGAMTSFVVVDTATPTPNPVEGVRVRIFTSPDDVLLTELDTDESGEASLVLEGSAGPAGKAYIVRLSPPSGYSGGPARAISVIDPVGPAETNVFDFIVYPPSEVPVSLDPDMCKVSGCFTDPSLRPLKNVTLIFHPREGYPLKVISGMPFSAEPTLVRSNIIASDLHVTTDKRGYIEIELPRKGVFDVFVQGLGAGDHTLQASIYIPDLPGIDISEVLFPYLTALTYSVPALALAVGESAEIEVALTSSNYQPVSGTAALNTLVEFTSSDPAIATVAVAATGALLVRAISAGAASIQASRVVGSFAPRRPAVPDLIISPASPVVTVA
jgi:co-chaperonin GroES (HSP10)